MQQAEIDPLDAFMAELESKVLVNSSIDKKESKFEDLKAIEEEERLLKEASKNKKLEDAESIEELLELAQRQTKRKELAPVDHSKILYLPFRKDFYFETGETKRMSEQEAELWRAELDSIKIRGKNCPKPIKKWSQTGLSPRILDIIQELGYDKPTPIQSQALPAVLGGRDIIAIAKTGSGKTMAFVLPMLRHVLEQPAVESGEGPIALVVTPTRELAIQTYHVMQQFCKRLKRVRCVCAYGGAPIDEQIAHFRRGTEIVICTPGRMIDLLLANGGRVTNLQRVTFLVLDEADRMFDMGFGPQIDQLVDSIRPDRQTVLFSATFPHSMEELARRVLHRPLEIIVGVRSTVCDDITQHVEVLEEDAKFVRLLELLGEWYPLKTRRILVFVEKQDSADELFKELLRRGYPCMSLHGSKDQADRDTALADFKSGVVPVLIATSVASRGLDVKELGLVINYDCPNHMEDYVHRVGRTGRAGQRGTAFTFITPKQEKYVPDIVKALLQSKTEIPDALKRMCDGYIEKVRKGTAQTKGSGFGGKGLEKLDETRETQKRAHAAAYQDEQEQPTVSKRPVNPKDALKVAKEMAAKVTQELVQRVGPTAIEEPPANSDSNLSEALQRGEIIPIYTNISKNSVPRSWACELPVNAFSPLVRQAICSPDLLRDISEVNGVVVQARGAYCAPGKLPTDRPLCVRIDGEHRHNVEAARRELIHHIKELINADVRSSATGIESF